MASQMAQDTITAEGLEAEKKSVVKKYDSDIKAVQLSASIAAQKIRNGFEMRPIKCEVKKDYETKMVSFIRTDTGELVRTRQMTGEERQMPLPEYE